MVKALDAALDEQQRAANGQFGSGSGSSSGKGHSEKVAKEVMRIVGEIQKAGKVKPTVEMTQQIHNMVEKHLKENNGKLPNEK